MIKEHDQQAKTKATPRRLAYANSDKEAPARSLARGFSDRFSLESSGTSDTHRQTRSAGKSQRTPSKNKEPAHPRRLRRLEDQSITKEKTRRERSKSRGKRSGHQETSPDSEYEEGSEDTWEDLNSPYKRPKPTPFTQRIMHFKYHQRGKAAQATPQRCHVVLTLPIETLLEASIMIAGIGEPISVDIKAKIIVKAEKFLVDLYPIFPHTPKSLPIDPTEIHGSKEETRTKQDKGLQAFMDLFKSKSSHIKRVHPVLRISAFMHGHGYLKLAKKLNDKIPKTVDEMFKRVRAFIKGEVVAGHNTNDIYQFKKHVEEVVASRKLAHLVKDIRRNNQRSGSQGRNNVKVINMIRGGGNHKIKFEGERSGLTDELTFPAIPWNQLTDELIILEGIIEDHQSSADRFLRRNVPPFRNNRPLSNYGKGKKKKNDANGICNSKMSPVIQRYNRKDRNEKP
ncbi:hypothetical protein Tco_0332636 [Tanacetum coccineum]